MDMMFFSLEAEMLSVDTTGQLHCVEAMKGLQGLAEYVQDHRMHINASSGMHRQTPYKKAHKSMSGLEGKLRWNASYVANEVKLGILAAYSHTTIGY